MSWNPNSQKHRAMHGGYKSKPAKSQVNALLNMYAKIDPKEKTNKELDLFA